MPTYTFKDLKTGEEFDKVMSYEDMLKYKKKKNIVQKIFTLPYDTLDVYKKIKKRRKDEVNSVNQAGVEHY